MSSPVGVPVAVRAFVDQRLDVLGECIETGLARLTRQIPPFMMDSP